MGIVVRVAELVLSCCLKILAPLVTVNISTFNTSLSAWGVTGGEFEA